MTSEITLLFTEPMNSNRGRHYYAVTYIRGEDPKSLRSDVCEALWAYEPGSSRLEVKGQEYRWRDLHEAVQRHTDIDGRICFIVKEKL